MYLIPHIPAVLCFHNGIFEYSLVIFNDNYSYLYTKSRENGNFFFIKLTETQNGSFEWLFYSMILQLNRLGCSEDRKTGVANAEAEVHSYENILEERIWTNKTERVLCRRIFFVNTSFPAKPFTLSISIF